MQTRAVLALFALGLKAPLVLAQAPAEAQKPADAQTPADMQTPTDTQLPAASASSAFANFTVGNIRVEGLQRVSEGTVYNYLPVNIGDALSERRVREAIRALYATGFFRDVQMRREDTTLVVVVLERPSIESFEITGNKDIKTEDLQGTLRNIGLVAGKTFDRSVLDELQQYMTDQYFSRGKYGVKVDVKVEEQSGNRVKVKVEIKEGKRARIRQINVVGNDQFNDKQVLDDFELQTPGWLSWYKQNDRYSRESLQGDLEKLRSFYMDRGYANFQVESTQVAIAPEKDDIFITVNIHEGDVFKISEVKMSGTFVVPEAELRRYLLVKPGQTFSRKLITSTQELLQNRLGQDGYAFAKVDPVPTPDNDKHEVSLTFFVDPGNRVYVRNITFGGADSINDEVLRREMRQLEGGWLSNTSLERSKQRVQRLPYVKKVDFETTPVPGAPDLVDVDFKVEEGSSAQLSGGIGYSESQSFILNGSYVDANFMGSGERIGLELNSGRYFKNYSFTHTDPYTSIDNLSRTIQLSYRDATQFTSAASDFDSETITAGLIYGYPISEYQGIQLGVNLQSSQLLTSSGSAAQAVDWVRNNGDTYSGTANTVFGPIQFYGTKFKAAELIGGWNYDSRNRTLFANRGSRYSISMSSTVPGSEVEYWTARIEALKYVPIWRKWALSLNVEGAYGDSLGDTTALPPYKQFFAGGPDSVRGFRENRLGPKDQNGRPYGGNLLVVARSELIFPLPEKWATTARASIFYDLGNVFYESSKVKFFDKGGFPIDYGFDASKLKASTGVAVQWLAPLGLFRFSFAVPLKKRSGSELLYGDETESFQFSIGQAF